MSIDSRHENHAIVAGYFRTHRKPPTPVTRHHGDLFREFVQSGTNTWQCVELGKADGAQQVHQDNAADVPAQNELKTALEKGSDEQKIETMVRPRNCNCPAFVQLAV